MPGIIPDEGEAQVLAVLLGRAPAEPLYLRLYVNARAPELDDTAADYDEMQTHGYVPKVLGPGDWTIWPAEPGQNTPARAEAREQTFVFTVAGPPVAVQGYFVTGAESGVLYGAQAAPEPKKAENNGDEITVQPTFALRSGAP